jgi:hypothetical protein
VIVSFAFCSVVDPDPAFQVRIDDQKRSKASKLQEKPSSLKREPPAHQNGKLFNFFRFLWVIFAVLDPETDPGIPLNPDPNRIWNHNTGALSNFLIYVWIRKQRELPRLSVGLPFYVEKFK